MFLKIEIYLQVIKGLVSNLNKNILCVLTKKSFFVFD